jgi:hypothetical protein
VSERKEVFKKGWIEERKVGIKKYKIHTKYTKER